MNYLSFLFAAIAYIIVTIFVFINYPAKWRKNHMFIALVILWHICGLVCTVIVFAAYRFITYEGLRLIITQIGTCYYITLTLQALLFIIRFVYTRALNILRRDDAISDNKVSKKWYANRELHALAIIVFSFVIFIIGYFNIDFIEDTKYEVSVDAPSDNEDLNICLIADIHAGSGTWEYIYSDVVDLVNENNPDVILIAGDVFDETTDYKNVTEVVSAFSKMNRPRLGTYFVYGNHDGIFTDEMLAQFEDLGITVLKDEMTIIGDDIQLIGCLDPKYHAKSMEDLFDELKPDLDKPIIMLAHRPKYFQKMDELGADLVLTGHTHGFNIPQFLGANLLGDMYYGIKYYNNTTAITTSGVSAWGYHYKFPAESEVVNVHVTFAQ